MKDLQALFTHFLRDIYHAERRILEALPEMADRAGSDALHELFRSRRGETGEQIENLERAFGLLKVSPRGVACEAIESILGEATGLVDETTDPGTRDAAMIAAVQAAGHYGITRYGTLVAWAHLLRMTGVADLLQRNLDREIDADRKLGEIAESILDRRAA